MVTNNWFSTSVWKGHGDAKEIFWCSLECCKSVQPNWTKVYSSDVPFGAECKGCQTIKERPT